MKRSTQWDIVGVFALVMSFVSFYIFMFGKGSLLIGLGNPLLMVVFLLFSFMSFAFGFYEGKKEEKKRVERFV